MTNHTTSNLCGEVFQHLTPDFTTCTQACIHPNGHRPESPHRCINGHEWYIDMAVLT